MTALPDLKPVKWITVYYFRNHSKQQKESYFIFPLLPEATSVLCIGSRLDGTMTFRSGAHKNKNIWTLANQW